MDYYTDPMQLDDSLEDVKEQQLEEENRQRVLAALSEILDSMEDSKRFLSEQEKKFALLRIEGNEVPEKSALNTLDTSEELEQYTFFIDPSGSVTETETEQLEQPKPKKRAPEEAAAVLVDSGYYDSLLMPKEYITTEHKIEKLLTTAETAEDFEEIIQLVSEQQARIKDATDRLIEDIKRYGSGKYVYTRQNELINDFREIRTKRGRKAKDTQPLAVEELIVRSAGAQIRDPDLVGPLGTTAQKLLDMAIIKHEETNSSTMEISLKEYTEIRGISKVAAYAQAKEDIETLSSTKIRFFNKDEKPRPGFPTSAYVAIVSSLYSTRGKIVVRFTPEYEALLKVAYKARVNIDIFKLNKPGSYAMISWALAYKHTNFADPNPKKQDRIRVKTLLDHAAGEIPSYEDVKKTDRHYASRIRKPFRTAMDEAKDLNIADWQYVDRNGSPVSIEDAGKLPFNEWEDLIVSFDWFEHPNDTEEAKEKAEKIATARTKLKEKELITGKKTRKKSKKNSKKSQS